MDLNEIRAIYARNKKVVHDVVDLYVSKHGCPCDWPQFEYWVSKEQGPGWQDGIQNDLADYALKLKMFHRKNSESSEHIICENCGREWRYSSEEWRMLAYQNRLIPLKSSILESQFNSIVSDNVFATVGLEPKNRKQLSIKEWAEFMLGHDYALPEVFVPKVAWFKRPFFKKLFRRFK